MTGCSGAGRQPRPVPFLLVAWPLVEQIYADESCCAGRQGSSAARQAGCGAQRLCRWSCLQQCSAEAGELAQCLGRAEEASWRHALDEQRRAERAVSLPASCSQVHATVAAASRKAEHNPSGNREPTSTPPDHPLGRISDFHRFADAAIGELWQKLEGALHDAPECKARRPGRAHDVAARPLAAALKLRSSCAQAARGHRTCRAETATSSCRRA